MVFVNSVLVTSLLFRPTGNVNYGSVSLLSETDSSGRGRESFVRKNSVNVKGEKLWSKSCVSVNQGRRSSGTERGSLKNNMRERCVREKSKCRGRKRCEIEKLGLM